MKDIKGYEGLYAVTSCGKVWSYKSKKFLIPSINSKKYLQVTLCKEGKSKQFLVHRLVAEAYIPNPDNLETVDHIDGNKEHNYINNLRWMTRADNTRKGRSKPIRCLENGIIYPSQNAAAKELGLDVGSVSKVVRGVMKQTKGFHFEYVINN